MSSAYSKRNEERSLEKFKKLDLKKTKSKIEVVHDGPIYICDSCHAMLMVPDEFLEEAEVEDEDEEGSFLLLEVSFECPKCNERNIVSEEELEEEEHEQPSKKEKKK